MAGSAGGPSPSSRVGVKSLAAVQARSRDYSSSLMTLRAGNRFFVDGRLGLGHHGGAGGGTIRPGRRVSLLFGPKSQGSATTEVSMTEVSLPPPERASPGPSAGRVYLVAALLSVLVSASTSVLVVYLLRPSVPLPGVNHDAKAAPEGAAPVPVKPIVEEGKVQVPVQASTKKGEVVVFYRTRFASPPQLTFPPNGLENNCFVVEQRADSFKLGRDETGPSVGYAIAPWVEWRAEGVPAK